MVVMVTCMEEETAKERIVADTTDKAICDQKLNQPKRLQMAARLRQS